MTVTPALHKLPYDTDKVVRADRDARAAPNFVSRSIRRCRRSVQELIALAKKQPGKLQYASSGVGTFLHLAGELFKLTAGVDILHVPFKGAAPAMIDVIGGHTQLMFASIGSTITAHPLRQVEGLRRRRDAAQSADPGRSDRRRIRPARLRRRQLVRDRRARRHAPADHREAPQGDFGDPGQPEMKKQFANEGAEIVRMSSAEFGGFIATELAKWGRVVKEAGIKPE